LRITPVYAPDPKRTADDVRSDMEQMGQEAFEAGKIIEAFDVVDEDYELLRDKFGSDGPYTIRLVAHDRDTIIRRAK